MMEPLEFGNGSPPVIPILNDKMSPGLLVSPQTRGTGGNHDSRLRIFSGNANPALAQVRLRSHIPAVSSSFLVDLWLKTCSIFIYDEVAPAL